MKKLVLVMLLLVSPAKAGCNVGSLPFQLQNGTVADANQVMANFNQIVDSLQTNCAGSGVNTDIQQLAGLTQGLSPALGGTTLFVATLLSGGTANAQTVQTAMPTAGWALIDGYQVQFVAGLANTGTMTVSVNGGTALPVVKSFSGGYAALEGGEFVAGLPVQLKYSPGAGAYIMMIAPNSVPMGGTAAQTFATPGLLYGNNTAPIVSIPLPLSTANGGTGQTAWRPTHNRVYIGSTGTYTASVGLISADIMCIGGGGAGGGTQATSGSQWSLGGGGGSGGMIFASLLASTIGTSQTVTIGTPGFGAAGAPGGAGGPTTFGGLLNAGGGQGGASQLATTATSVAGGPGGTASGGDVVLNGTTGGMAMATIVGGTALFSGRGANGFEGQGGAANVFTNSSAIAVGASATGYGAGGAGSVAGSGQASTSAGGNGSPGLCIVDETIGN